MSNEKNTADASASYFVDQEVDMSKCSSAFSHYALDSFDKNSKQIINNINCRMVYYAEIYQAANFNVNQASANKC